MLRVGPRPRLAGGSSPVVARTVDPPAVPAAEQRLDGPPGNAPALLERGKRGQGLPYGTKPVPLMTRKAVGYRSALKPARSSSLNHVWLVSKAVLAWLDASSVTS